MNKKAKGVGGRHSPPNDRLIGRTAAGRILQCDKRTIVRYEQRGFLTPVVENGVHWFDRAAVKRLATMLLRLASGLKRVVGKSSGPPPAQADTTDGYYPELRARSRALPREEAKPHARKAPVVAPAPAPRDVPAPATRTRLPDDWWDKELPAPDPEPGKKDPDPDDD